jgi:hypothetical protein
MISRIAAEPARGYSRYRGVQKNPEKLREDDRYLESEIDPVACVVFLLIVFLIVPFTLLSPFSYPQTSTLDKFLSVNSGQYVARGSEAKLSGKPVLDLSMAAADETGITGTLTR